MAPLRTERSFRHDLFQSTVCSIDVFSLCHRYGPPKLRVTLRSSMAKIHYLSRGKGDEALVFVNLAPTAFCRVEISTDSAVDNFITLDVVSFASSAD
jgi:hypothetical protein